MFFWALLDFRLCYSSNTLYLWCLADVPAHNILRWTPRQPITRKTFPERRGLPHEYRDKWLDPDWLSIDQNEAGLTTEKTFTWPGWSPLLRCWWLLTAQIIPYEPASTSPLFSFTSPSDPAWEAIWEENWSA